MELTPLKVCSVPMTCIVMFTCYRLALKSEALAWRFTGDPTDVQNTFDRIDMVYKYHGRASGTSRFLVYLALANDAYLPHRYFFC